MFRDVPECSMFQILSTPKSTCKFITKLTRKRNRDCSIYLIFMLEIIEKKREKKEKYKSVKQGCYRKAITPNFPH